MPTIIFNNIKIGIKSFNIKQMDMLVYIPQL